MNKKIIAFLMFTLLITGAFIGFVAGSVVERLHSINEKSEYIEKCNDAIVRVSNIDFEKLSKSYYYCNNMFNISCKEYEGILNFTKAKEGDR